MDEQGVTIGSTGEEAWQCVPPKNSEMCSNKAVCAKRYATTATPETSPRFETACRSVNAVKTMYSASSWSKMVGSAMFGNSGTVDIMDVEMSRSGAGGRARRSLR